ncbi:transmembrane protein 42-like [Macrobrachium nipponense]|uniref:transmembrane protein 42-like n=1 Tax=Macrobrachium nipponense TaxID=159736 RepID=UPI0030C7BD1B
MHGQLYAVASGLFAAIASLCGKYAMASSEAQYLCESMLLALSQDDDLKQTNFVESSCNEYSVFLRIVFFAFMIGTNCVMWTMFTKALRFSHTTLEATITNTAANFFFTAILGQVLFGEVVRSLWWMGTVLIISGLLLMHHASNLGPRKPGTRPKLH